MASKSMEFFLLLPFLTSVVFGQFINLGPQLSEVIQNQEVRYTECLAFLSTCQPYISSKATGSSPAVTIPSSSLCFNSNFSNSMSIQSNHRSSLRFVCLPRLHWPRGQTSQRLLCRIEPPILFLLAQCCRRQHPHHHRSPGQQRRS